MNLTVYREILLIIEFIACILDFSLLVLVRFKKITTNQSLKISLVLLGFIWAIVISHILAVFIK